LGLVLAAAATTAAVAGFLKLEESREVLGDSLGAVARLAHVRGIIKEFNRKQAGLVLTGAGAAGVNILALPSASPPFS
jgi:hypothetical protein